MNCLPRSSGRYSGGRGLPRSPEGSVPSRSATASVRSGTSTAIASQTSLLLRRHARTCSQRAEQGRTGLVRRATLVTPLTIERMSHRYSRSWVGTTTGPKPQPKGGPRVRENRTRLDCPTDPTRVVTPSHGCRLPRGGALKVSGSRVPGWMLLRRGNRSRNLHWPGLRARRI